MRITKAQAEAETRERAAFDAGCEHYAADPEALLTAVYRTASARYPDSKPEMFEFAYGYSTMRARADAYRREQANEKV